MVPGPIHCFVHFLLKCHLLIGVFPDHLIQKRAAPPFPMACFSFLPSPLCYLHCIMCSLMTSSPWWSIPWYSVDSLLCCQCPEECLAPWETQQISVNEWMIEKKKRSSGWGTQGEMCCHWRNWRKRFKKQNVHPYLMVMMVTLDLGAGVPPLSLLLVWQRLLCKDGHCSLESNSKTLTQMRTGRPH